MLFDIEASIVREETAPINLLQHFLESKVEKSRECYGMWSGEWSECSNKQSIAEEWKVKWNYERQACCFHHMLPRILVLRGDISFTGAEAATQCQASPFFIFKLHTVLEIWVSFCKGNTSEQGKISELLLMWTTNNKRSWYLFWINLMMLETSLSLISVWLFR